VPADVLRKVPTKADEPQHQLVRSDCLAFLRGLPDASVDLIATDPAYSGMNQHLKLGHGRIVGSYQNAGEPGERWFQEFRDDPASFRELLRQCHRVLRDDRHVYVMFDSYSLLTLGPLVREVFDVKNVLVWDKLLIGMGHYFRRRHELIVFASKGKRPMRRRDLPDVWRFKRLVRAPYPTQKPVELFEAMIEASCEPGFVVVDPFMGSGSCAVAAERHGCSFWGCDVSANAVESASTRLEAVTRGLPDPLQPGSAAESQPRRPKRRRTAATKSRTSGVRRA
jgi:site-specific DNA-methyltransferase (adenine-specific)